MKIYTIYINPADPKQLENAIFVREGFAWFAAALHAFWAFYRRMWKVGIALLLIEILLVSLQTKGLIGYDVAEAIKFGILIFIGFNFNDWYRYHLEKKSYILHDVISGKNEDEARYKFLCNILQRSSFASGKEQAQLV